MTRYWPIALLVFVHCSPRVTFKLAFELADKTPIESSKLHLRTLGSCNGDSPLPATLDPGIEEDHHGDDRAAGNTRMTYGWIDRKVDPDDHREHAQVSFRASHCEVMLTAWYDADGDGAVGKGDYVGRLAGARIETGSMCTSSLDLNNLGVLILNKQ